MSEPEQRTTAIVPLKALAEAKGRLATELGAAARMEVAAWMAGRVISACRDAAGVDSVLLVAGDEAAAGVGRDRGIDVLVVPEPGLQVALDAADAATTDATTTLVVAADLPLATAVDIDAVIAAAPEHGVVVVPTNDGGTGVLLRRPGGLMPTAYGPGSGQRHLDHAAALGVSVRRLEIASLALDVDTPGALAEAGRRTRLPPGVEPGA